MGLMTKEIKKDIPNLMEQSDKGYDAIVYVKFFSPDSQWTWYVLGFDPLTRLCYGLVSGYVKEFGTFLLDDLEQLKGPYGYKVERDTLFSPDSLRNILGN